MPKVTFSTNSISKMICPEGKQRKIFYDLKQPKLACIVSKSGVKTFALHTWDRLRKKPIQKTIGRYPEVSINQGRDEASKLLARLTSGEDIIEAARAIRTESTVNDIFKNWLDHAKEHKRTWREDERRYQRHIAPYFGNLKVSMLTLSQVRKWHTNLPKKYRQNKLNGKKAYLSKATANRCLALLRVVYNHSSPEVTNPCNGVKMYKEVSRDRFLKPAEMKQFFNAVYSAETSTTTRDFVLLLLLTGARRSNLLSMQWGEVDFSQQLWTIPESKSKNKETMTIPLVNDAIEILQCRKGESQSVFVFPGRGKTGHLAEPRKGWESLLRRAGLDNIRLHDLRRTCGSYQAANGSSLPIIGKSLGHKNIATTAIYSRLEIDPVRESMEMAAQSMKNAAGQQNRIIPIKREHNG